MINVISVKWGTKYSSEEVNRLYRMVKKNLTIPFIFYCFTEDPEGLDSNIQIIDNPYYDYLDGVWNKMCLFNSELMPNGTNLFFDIDVIIQDNIDYLLDYKSQKLTKIYAYWKEYSVQDDSADDPRSHWDMNGNSSILLWENGTQDNIWKLFDTNPDNYMMKYRGIDRFIWHEGFNVNYFPEGTIYSRIHGKDLESIDEYTDLIPRSRGFKEYAYYYPNHKICIFNGPVLPEHYIGFEKYFK